MSEKLKNKTERSANKGVMTVPRNTMDWQKQKEEYKELYYPKRKVNNKNSNYVPHIMGMYYSKKMHERIVFESLNEFVAFSLLEMSCVVKAYYPQPVEVQIEVYNSKGRPKTWNHVPDVLVFVEDSKPCLYQIKGKVLNKEPSKRAINVEKACLEYAGENDWDYKLIFIHSLGKDFIWNIRFLFPFLNDERANFEIAKSIITELSVNQQTTIWDLTTCFEPKIERQYVLPVIYHELAVGTLYIDLTKRLDTKSPIRLSKEDDADYYQYLWEL